MRHQGDAAYSQITLSNLVKFVTCHSTWSVQLTDRQTNSHSRIQKRRSMQATQWRHRSAGGPLTDLGLGAPPLDPITN